MSKRPVEKVLILTSRQAAAQRLAAMLQSPGWEIWADRCEMPQNERPTVVVTDGTAADSGETAAWEAGTLRLGPAPAAVVGPAEVQLPENATACELQVTCQLLGQIVHLQRQHRDGAELRRRLFQEAFSDPLTGLPNRRAWDRTLAERLATLHQGERLCLALLDLDSLKRVNDTYGHLAGDHVLQQCGRVLNDSLRQHDFVARFGGDEFGLLLWVPDEETAAAVVERVRAQVPRASCQPAAHAGEPVAPGTQPPLPPVPCVVTASAGYCLTPPQPSASPLPSPALLLAAADLALRRAKQRGRNRTVQCDEPYGVNGEGQSESPWIKRLDT
jgi:diguanylate cyclase (GGDEF)-like protein